MLRAQHNRTLNEGDKLWSRVTAGESVAFGQGQRAREVVQQVWAQAVQLPDGQGGSVQATCLVAREMEPPAGDKPVEWRLLTNVPVTSMQEAARMIDWYRARWETRDVLSCAKKWLPH